MLRVAIVDDSGTTLYDISLRTEKMEEKDLFPILHSSDPRSAYENWIQKQAANHSDNDAVQKDVQQHLADLDKKITEARRNGHRVHWERERP